MQREFTGARVKAWCLLIMHTEAYISPSWGSWRRPGASLYKRKRRCHPGVAQGESLVPPYTHGSISHGGQGESLVRPYTRGSVSLAHGGQGESLVPPCTHGSVSLSRGAGRKTGASLYTRKRLSLTGGRAKAWCLLIHTEVSLSLQRRFQLAQPTLPEPLYF